MQKVAALFMPELLTTEEAAAYLRLSERKLYELIAAGAVPCSKVTGRWLFPKAALDRWLATGLPPALRGLEEPAPPIVGGSHDPLLEWALRESNCALASLPEGSEAGLRRLARRELVAAAIHLHPLQGAHETANCDTVATAPGLHDAVVIGFVRREQGLLVAAGNPLSIARIEDLLRPNLRVARRQDGAGAQLLLLSLLARAKVEASRLAFSGPVCATGTEIAERIRLGEADCGIASRAVARATGLGFVPLLWENFDLVLRQRDYFLPRLSALLGFVRSERFRRRAEELQGYDLAETGLVRLVR